VKLLPRASEKEALVEISRLRFLRPTKGVFDISMVIAASEQELKAAMASTAEVVEDFMIARSRRKWERLNEDQDEDGDEKERATICWEERLKPTVGVCGQDGIKANTE
jgi:hypothetical protein